MTYKKNLLQNAWKYYAAQIVDHRQFTGSIAEETFAIHGMILALESVRFDCYPQFRYQ